MEREWDGVEAPAWLHLLGWADREIEKQLLEGSFVPKKSGIEKHLEIRGSEEMQQFKATTSSKKPRFAMIPYHALEALAERFDVGEQKHGVNTWNALSAQTAMEDEAWIISRLEHVVHHAYQYLGKLKGLIPDDGDDDAAAIMWGGCVLSESKRIRDSKPKRKRKAT